MLSSAARVRASRLNGVRGGAHGGLGGAHGRIAAAEGVLQGHHGVFGATFGQLGAAAGAQGACHGDKGGCPRNKKKIAVNSTLWTKMYAHVDKLREEGRNDYWSATVTEFQGDRFLPPLDKFCSGLRPEGGGGVT